MARRKQAPRFGRVIEGPPFRVLMNSTREAWVVYEAAVSIDGSLAHCNCVMFYRKGECPHADYALQQWRLRKGAAMQDQQLDFAPPSAPPANGSTALAVRQEAVPDVVRSPLILGRPPRSLLPTGQEMRSMAILANKMYVVAGQGIPSCWDSGPKAFMAIMQGWELGVRPLVALNNMFIVNGRLGMYAELMMGIVQQRDPTAKFVWTIEAHYDAANAKEPTGGAEVELWRSGILVSRGRWMVSDAIRAQQIKLSDTKFLDSSAPWARYPTRMLAWAAVKIAVRLGASDLIHSIEGAPVDEGPAGPMALPGPDDLQLETPEKPEGFDRSYVWAEPLRQRMKGAEIGPEHLDRWLPADPEKSLEERIEAWLFDTEVHDLAARIDELVAAVLQPVPATPGE